MAELQLKSSRFRIEREGDWKRLEKLLARVEGGSVARLSVSEMLEIPVLYRSALSSLSVARSISLDQSLVDYLESLSARAYFLVYGVRTKIWDRIAHFFTHDWPGAIRAIGRETLVAAAIGILGAVVAYVLVTHDADWFYSFMPGGLTEGRDPTASVEALRKTLHSSGQEGGGAGLSTLATFLFTHNAQIAMLAFALGFAFGVPTMALLLSNGFMLGAFLALFISKGLGVEVVGWLMIHGVTELFAVTLAGAAGLKIGWSVAFPGRRSRLDALSESGQLAALVMGGVIVMLFVAGLLEGFARQIIQADWLRYAIAIATASIWGAYFYLPRREKARG